MLENPDAFRNLFLLTVCSFVGGCAIGVGVLLVIDWVKERTWKW